MHSSLFFQIITHFNFYYLLIYIAFEALLHIFKEVNLPYPPLYVACDLTILIGAVALEFLRLDLGRKGNLTEKQLPVFGCLILTIPCVFAGVYILLWQTYVLKIEIILAGILFVFHALEVIYLPFLAFGFSKL